MATVLTSDKGRILDLLTVLRFPDRLLLLTAPGNQGAVAQWIEKYTITEDAQTTDVTGATALLHCFGPKAGALASASGLPALEGLPPLHHAQATIASASVTVLRTPGPAGDGFSFLLADSAQAPAVRAALSSVGQALGLRPSAEGLREIGPDAYDILRIEAGEPAFGHELGERFNPLEAGLRPHVSFNKGCYIGQEVVARLDTYQKVQRSLVGLLLPGEALPQEGSSLQANGKDAGMVTSAAWSPGLRRAIALAYLRGAHATPGARLQAATSAGPVEAEVVALPIVK
jgi:folate-binding protein YgfZ